MIYIYRITHRSSGKTYWGQTNNPKRRWAEHRNPNSECVYLRNAILKYGSSSFDFVVEKETSDRNVANELERDLIVLHKTTDKEIGYNLQEGGCGGSPNEATRKKMSVANKGRVPFMKGRKHTEESKIRMSIAQIGHSRPCGKPRTEAEKLAISSFHKGKKLSKETRDKISAGQIKGPKIELSGKTFGYLTFIKATNEYKNKRILWEVLCECGKIIFRAATQITSGGAKSCGCRRKEIRRANQSSD